ncbi:MAG TPA: energy transducer TonB, partial [Thermoanaerobaculia bacterium]|nr:energy transducer TonB [Thermoanaerobaculia bacterium]
EAQYPDGLHQTQQQGNVLLIARIDKQGKLQDIAPIATSSEGFIAPALDAVRLWTFKPATKDGKPIEIAVNIGVRFRIQIQGKRGEIPRPMLGDLAISPADNYGRPTAPEGFPIRSGAVPKLLAAALLDVSLNATARSVQVNVEAWSPTGRRIPVYKEKVLIPANATELKVPVVVPIKPDWEDGVWMLRFFVADADAGGGQFWLAKDPATFDFASKMPKPQALPN